MEPQHGTPGAYARGCHCEPCRAAHRLRQREYRMRQRGGVPKVVDLPVQAEPGDVAQAVKRELDGLRAAVDQPGIAAAAMAMARLLDEPAATPQHPAAAARLRDLLVTLREGSAGAAGGKLARLRADAQAFRDGGA